LLRVLKGPGWQGDTAMVANRIFVRRDGIEAGAAEDVGKALSKAFPAMGANFWEHQIQQVHENSFILTFIKKVKKFAEVISLDVIARNEFCDEATPVDGWFKP